jgi:hypothetical protein
VWKEDWKRSAFAAIPGKFEAIKSSEQWLDVLWGNYVVNGERVNRGKAGQQVSDVIFWEEIAM